MLFAILIHIQRRRAREMTIIQCKYAGHSSVLAQRAPGKDGLWVVNE